MPSVKSKYQDQLRTHCGGIGTHCRGIAEVFGVIRDAFGDIGDAMGTHLTHVLGTC